MSKDYPKGFSVLHEELGLFDFAVQLVFEVGLLGEVGLVEGPELGHTHRTDSETS